MSARGGEAIAMADYLRVTAIERHGPWLIRLLALAAALAAAAPAVLVLAAPLLM
jgi:hypothetical protein